MNPLVSVILTSYNKVCYLSDAIESVIDQTYPDWECVLIDDYSTDGSWEISKDYAKKEPRIKVVRTDLIPDHEMLICNRYAHNCNFALEHTNGEFITYLCDDDYYLTNRNIRFVGYFHDHPEITCAYGKQAVVDDTGTELVYRGLRACPPIVEHAAGVMDHSSFMVRRSVIDRVGGWDECPESWLIGDAYFFERLSQAGYRFHLIDDFATDIHRYNKFSVNYEYAEGRGPKLHTPRRSGVLANN